MEKEPITPAYETKFICSIEQNVIIMCERHAKAFELAATATHDGSTG